MTTNKEIPQAGNQGDKQHGNATEGQFNSTFGHSVLDAEIAVLRCLLACSANGVAQLVKDTGLEAQDFHSQQRREVYTAILEHVHAAINAGYGHTNVDAAQIITGMPESQLRIMQEAVATNSFGGTVDSPYTLHKRIKRLKYARAIRGAEHVGNALQMAATTNDLEQVINAVNQVPHLQKLIQSVPGAPGDLQLKGNNLKGVA